MEVAILLLCTYSQTNIVKHPLGRSKRKKIPSRREVVQRIRCSRCEKIGNRNRKTCKELI
ncbi:hypothetical protein HYC85_012647 [Camellia sinensis]|uniref:Uncharacterized protein n=1 Tax=Camellia sinensis TaxID=4442 RepID=A0A7J7HFE4_CAMSI|nr:hypothetical protein HYC85_012647 [Camellia sinensis]